PVRNKARMISPPCAGGDDRLGRDELQAHGGPARGRASEKVLAAWGKYGVELSASDRKPHALVRHSVSRSEMATLRGAAASWPSRVTVPTAVLLTRFLTTSSEGKSGVTAARGFLSPARFRKAPRLPHRASPPKSGRRPRSPCRSASR